MGEEEGAGLRPRTRDPRLSHTDQQKFSKSAGDVLKMFDDQHMKSHSILSRSGNLGDGTSMAGPTKIEGASDDPLKAAAQKASAEGEHAGMQKKPKTYKEHLDRLGQVYSQYLDVDLSPKVKRMGKRL
jgi:hypothetical protein